MLLVAVERQVRCDASAGPSIIMRLIQTDICPYRCERKAIVQEYKRVLVLQVLTDEVRMAGFNHVYLSLAVFLFSAPHQPHAMHPCMTLCPVCEARLWPLSELRDAAVYGRVCMTAAAVCRDVGVWRGW